MAAGTLRPPITKLRDALQPVLGLPAVGAKIRQAVDEMLANLEAFVTPA